MSSPKQITRQRQTVARDLLIRAWRRVEIYAAAPKVSDADFTAANRALVEAVAMAEEWGLDPHAVLEESHPASVRTQE